MESLLDQVSARFGVTVADGVQVLAKHALVTRPFDPGMALVVVPDEPTDTDRPGPETSFIPATLPGRAAHGASASEMLRALYPASHPVYALKGADTTVGRLTDDDLQAGAHFVAALGHLENMTSPYSLPWLVARLRAPDGCPWDREQNHLTLRKFLVEETYEVYDALEQGSTPQLAEELGDLLLQVILHAQYAAEAGVFDLTDVHREVMSKIVRRHPHVFGDVVADSAAEVIRNWEEIKAGERAARSNGAAESAPSDSSMPPAFAGLSRSLPALAYAQEMQERAASLGYDWPSVEGVLEKVREEADELVAARDDGERREEFGDLLMVLVNLARRLNIDSEAALRSASGKFAARFAHVERLATEREVELRNLSLDELDALWEEAKVAAR